MADYFADEPLVVSSPIFDQVSALVASKSPFISSGAAAVQFEDVAGMGGHQVARRYSDLDGDHDTPITGTALTPLYLNAISDVAPVCRRARFRRVLDGQGAAEGGMLAKDPTARVIATQADWWAKEIDLMFLAALDGAFDSSAGVLRTTHVKDITDGTHAQPLTFSTMLAAGQLLGDAGQDLRLLVCRSEVASGLAEQAGQKLDARPIGDAPFLTSLFIGTARVLISDMLPTEGSGLLDARTSYLLAPGSLWAATQQSIREFRQIRADLPAVDVTTSWHLGVGIGGLSVTSGVINPTNAVLGLAATWGLSVSPQTEASRKSIRVVKIISN